MNDTAAIFQQMKRLLNNSNIRLFTAVYKNAESKFIPDEITT